MRRTTIFLIAVLLGCTESKDSPPQQKPPLQTVRSPSQPANKAPAEAPSSINPLDATWPALVGKRIEVTGKLFYGGRKGDDRARMLFKRTFLEVSGDFNKEAHDAPQLRVSGILTREHHSGAPLGDRARENGRVWETFLLKVDEWTILGPDDEPPKP
ncbi:MAG: hypothetical protein AABP62_28020 [Planctomycetota bacterium]